MREQEEIIIMMRQDNEIIINNIPVSIDQLFLTLSKSSQKNKDALVIIQADREVYHGNVVEVMDTVKRAGYKRLAIATSMIKGTVSKGGEGEVPK